jgi:hypothetical protein
LPPEDVTVVATGIQSLPERFAELTRPVQINGTILSLQDNGLFTFHTAAGDLILNLLTPAAAGGRNPLAALLTPFVQNQKPLSLSIQAGTPPTQALLSLPASLQTAASLASKPVVQTGLQTAPAGPAFTPGTIVTTLVLPAGVAKSFSSASMAPTAPLAPGLQGLSGEIAAQTAQAASNLTFTGFLSTPLKATELANFLKTPLMQEITENLKAFVAGMAAMPESPETATAVQTAQPQAAQGAIAAALKTGAEWNVRLVTVLPPNTPLPTAETPDQIVATVVGKGPDGQLLLNAGDKSLFIRQGGDVQTGSRLILTFLQPATKPDLMFPMMDERGFSGLHQVMAALHAIDPQMAHQFMQNRMPQPNEALPGALLFLFNALQQGGLQGWLGDGVSARLDRAGKYELIARLAEEMQRESGIARDPTVGQWRTWPIPLYDGSQFQMLRLYVRRESDRKQTDAGYPVSPQTRFIISMNMTRLGAMQLDGLSQKKQLDLIVRSENALPQSLPGELRTVYIKTLDALGLAGTLHFQTGRQNWVAVQKVAEPAKMQI